MVMLSHLLRHRLVDLKGRRASLVDLQVDLASGDYPPVTHLVYRGPDRRPRRLAWEAVRAAGWREAQLEVANLDSGQPAPAEALERSVLLARDVMDALLLDLADRQATRANDLWLVEEHGQLALRGADLSPWAVVRRLGRGLLGAGADRDLLDWTEVEFLRGDPCAARAGGDYHRRVARLQPAEIARLVDAVPYLHAAELLTLLPDPVAADALEAMAPERQLQVFEELEEDLAARMLELMAPNLAADLLSFLEPGRALHFLDQLPDARRERIVELLRFPPDTAGGIMTNDVIVAEAELTVGDARRKLRDRLMEPDFVYYLYVIDDLETQRLRGVLTLRDLLVAPEHRTLEEVMQPDVLAIGPFEAANLAAYRLSENQLAALPVVDRNGRLLGAITFDAAILQLAPSSWRDQAPRVFS